MKRALQQRSGPSAFTLIELLVVVTIIIVLLAMLTPALDTALYQAKLASCASQIKGHITGVHQYAFDQNRFYPDRWAYRTDIPGAMMLKARIATRPDVEWRDDRPKLKGYVAVDIHLDPLCSKDIDLEGDNDFSYVASSYLMYYDWGYQNAQVGPKHSSRFGQPFEFEGREFRVLVSDQDWITVADNGWSISSHPDDRSVMELLEYQNWESVGPGLSEAAGYSATMARWQEWRVGRRGLIDANHGMDDGSLQRFVDVPYDAERGPENYEGLARIADVAIANTATDDAAAYYQVPLR